MDTRFERLADLHFAFQHGQDAAKGNFAQVEAEFAAIFGDNAEARAEFDRGVAEQDHRSANSINAQHAQ